jgi:hypothetical protein
MRYQVLGFFADLTREFKDKTCLEVALEGEEG